MSSAYVSTALPEIDNTQNDPSRRAPLVVGEHDFASVTETVCSIAERPRPPRAWYIAFGFSLTLLGVMGAMIAYLIYTGIGVWGLNHPVNWGWAIVN